jgi:large subunit ribosomal protein L29
MATANELREQSPEELKARAVELKHSLFEMKGKHNTGLLDSSADMGKAKRDVARCLTLIREAELGLARKTGAKAAVSARAEKVERTEGSGEPKKTRAKPTKAPKASKGSKSPRSK